MAEYFPALAPYLESEGLSLDHPSLQRLLPALRRHRQVAGTSRRRRSGRPPARRAARGGARPPSRPSTWPPRCSPACCYERLDELGIDFSVVYPSLGLVFLHTADETLPARHVPGAQPVPTPRRSRRCADRLTPVAAIPMHTPEEAVAELEYAVNDARVQGGAAAPATCSARSSALGRARSRRVARTPSGSTSSASTAPTTTTRCGPRPRSSASRSPSTRASSG